MYILMTHNPDAGGYGILGQDGAMLYTTDIDTIVKNVGESLEVMDNPRLAWSRALGDFLTKDVRIIEGDKTLFLDLLVKVDDQCDVRTTEILRILGFGLYLLKPEAEELYQKGIPILDLLNNEES